MPWFEYEGLTPGGTVVSGRLEAVDHDQAAKELVELRIDVRELRAASAPPAKAAPLSSEDLIFFNHQLASLAQAGIALDQGLAQLARDVESSRLKRWLEALVHDLQRGASLDEAIRARESGLPIFYSRIIKAGVESGQLAATLLNLNHHLRIMAETKRYIWEAATYPLIVISLAMLVVSLFMMMVVPKFQEIFTDFGTTLPGLTVWLLALGQVYIPFLIGLALTVVIVVVAWKALSYSQGGMRFRELLLSLLPFIGQIHRAALLSRFFRATATSIVTGISLPQSLRLAADTTGSVPLIDEAEQMAAEVEQGRSPFAAAQSMRVIPSLFGFCLQAGGTGDALPLAIARLADSYDARARNYQTLLRSVLSPILVLLLGGLLALIIIGVFLPLVQLLNAVSGGVF